MRSLPKRHLAVPSKSVAFCLTTAALVACADSPTTGPNRAPGPQLAALPTCEWIDFNNFAQGQPINSVSVLGLNLTVTTTAFPDPSNVANPEGAVAFETDGLNDDLDGVGSIIMEDDDLQYRGEDSPYDDDLVGGECTDCAGLGKVLIIQDPAGFVPWGDYAWGGLITFSDGFTGGGYEYYIASYTALDVDQNSPGIRLYVDGTQVAQSPANAGNGSVAVVPVTTVYPITNSFAFQLGSPEVDEHYGSGAIDNIQICRVQTEVTGNEGCTLGYWKQDQHFDSWVTYTPDQDLSTVFTLASFSSLGGDSFLQALNYKGGPDAISAARLLLKQAVAGLLNAASPDVDYALTTQQILDQVNAALASGDRSTMLTLASTLDGYNNANCTLN